MTPEGDVTIDVERARKDTPGCERVLHLNNAGSSLPPRQVLDAVIGHLELEGRMGATRPTPSTSKPSTVSTARRQS